VFGVLPGVIGSIQATETIKVLLGIGEPLLGRFLNYDALAMKWSELRLQRDPKCQVCGDHPTITRVTSVAAQCEVVSSASATDTSSLEISVDELQQMRTQRVTHFLVDVRSAGEASICQIKGSKLIPLSELPTRVDELPRNQRIVVYCKVGGRSANAVKYLCEQGFINVRSLRGGVMAWIDSIEGTLARY
jgi:adenylyltransferase/sulfurtransferase